MPQVEAVSPGAAPPTGSGAAAGAVTRTAIGTAGRPRPRRRRRSLAVRLAERFAAPILTLVLLACWQIAVPLLSLSAFVLPTPSAIGIELVDHYQLMLGQAWYTLIEVVAGFGLAVLVGLPTALVIFYSRLFERAVYPLLVALQTIPKIALAPLLVLYLGYGWAPKISMAFLISFFPIVIATVIGLRSLDADLVKLIRSMGASEAQTFWKIRLPAALPNVFGGLKVAISLAVIGAIIGEYVASDRGLGHLQLLASSQFNTTRSFAAVVAISVLGVLLFAVVDFVELRLVHRRRSAR
jgi:NitT/TauT family transport system permease protein